MAARLRRWILVVLGGMALVAALTLPPVPRVAPRLWWAWSYRARDLTPAEQVQANLGRELEAAAMILKRQVRLDTLRSILEWAAGSPGEVLVHFPPGPERELGEGLRTLAERELDRPSPRRGDAQVALVGLDQAYGDGMLRGVPVPTFLDLETEVFVVSAPHGTSCVVLLPTPPT